MKKTLLKVEDLTVYYGYINALKNVSLEVDEGEIITLIGGNGAGKNHNADVHLQPRGKDKREGKLQWRGYHQKSA